MKISKKETLHRATAPRREILPTTVLVVISEAIWRKISHPLEPDKGHAQDWEACQPPGGSLWVRCTWGSTTPGIAVWFGHLCGLAVVSQSKLDMHSLSDFVGAFPCGDTANAYSCQLGTDEKPKKWFHPVLGEWANEFIGGGFWHLEHQKLPLQHDWHFTKATSLGLHAQLAGSSTKESFIPAAVIAYITLEGNLVNLVRCGIFLGCVTFLDFLNLIRVFLPTPQRECLNSKESAVQTDLLVR